jgi:signal transduction histidine kinase/DNA-binding response OmpR family regulator
VVEHRLETIKQEIRYIVEDKRGSLWLATSTGGVLKVGFPVAVDKPAVTWYETSHGLPGGRVYTTEAAGHVLFATEKGIFLFDEKNNVFIPDKIIGDEFAGGSKPVFRLIEDKNKHIWFHSESKNFRAVPGTAGSFSIDSQPFRRIPAVQVNAIYPDPDGKSTWFASLDGLLRYDTTVKKNYEQDFNVLIRKAVVNGNLLFDGSSVKHRAGSKHRIFTIKYADRKNFHFEFAGVFFDAEAETRYRYLLTGHDDRWAAWSRETEKDFTTLDSGQYVFRVQAKNVYGRLGEATFQFKILPPWHQTWWAFLLYGAGFFLLMFLAVKWRSHNLEQDKQKLEITIQERTKEIREKNKQLKDQSKKLKEMDSIKSRFFANISHEFRTPLTLIMGPLEQMLSDSRDTQQQEKLDMMLRNSRRLLTSINQLLDLSRFDSGKMKLKAACQDVVSFMRGIFSSFYLAAQENRLIMEFHSGKKTLPLYFDAPKMEDVMNNLLINAFKFTSSGGEITVSLYIDRQAGEKPSAGFVNISVRDTGIGIAKEQLPHIFDRFYQVDGPGQEALKGTGIGLALIKENVALHHGKIDVHSQEGKGTEFVIRLPLGHEHLDPGEITPPPAASTQAKEYKEIELLDMLSDSKTEEQNNEGTAAANTGPDRKKPLILVVEDHADVRKYICEPLKKDYRVIEAADGQEGIKKAGKFFPDLIVSDIMMPRVNGCQLCRELKNDIKTSHIPIILLTAKASEESIIQGFETGADDYVTKPFNSKILATRIKNLIELRRQLQQKIQKQMLLQPDEIAVSSMDRKFIAEMQEVIEANLSKDKFHVEALCKKLYMNRVTLFRKVKALTGESPTEFIRSYRLKRAAQLLRDNFGNVSEVAVEVGFSNLGYFTRCFKEKFQQLPSTYQATESK